MQHLLQSQKAYFDNHLPLSYQQRIDALSALQKTILTHEKQLIAAVNQDFGRRVPQETVLLELVPLISEIKHYKRYLKKWMKPQSVVVDWTFKPSKAQILHQPLGVVGIMGAWNYPISLVLTPLVNAIGAGNCAMIKPSELAPHTSKLIAQIISEIYPPGYVTVVEGGVDVATEFAQLPFNHLIFTGSGRVGQKVLAAAAQNMTPVTLELGGKSPAIIHPEYDLKDACDKILSSKLWNAGQTCIAPDYVWIHESQLETALTHFKTVSQQRFSDSFLDSITYTSMINTGAKSRMEHLVSDAISKGAHALNLSSEVSNSSNQVASVFSPVILTEVTDDMMVMSEEIFGPILPIKTYQHIDEVIEYINRHDRPLSLYYFDCNQHRIQQILSKTHAGGVSINDCMLHYAQTNLPFGGVGDSGIGAYHGHCGFVRFSHAKSVYYQNKWVGRIFGILAKAPYSNWTNRLISLLLGRK